MKEICTTRYRIRDNNFFSSISKKFSGVFCCILGLISLAIAIFIWMHDIAETYKFLPLLPFITSVTFFLSAMIAVKRKSVENGGALLGCLVFVTYFIRNVLSSLIFVIDDYGSVFRKYDAADFRYAVILMSYETIIVFWFVGHMIKKSREKEAKMVIKRRKISLTRKNRAFWYYLLLIGATIVCIICLIISRELRTTYYSIFSKNYADVLIETIDASATGIHRIAYTGGMLLINSVRFVLPITVITILAKKQTFFRLCLCVLISCTQVMFMTDGNAYILFLVIVQVLYVIKVFPKYDKGLIIGFTIIFCLAIGLILVNRFSYTHFSSSLSSFMQSYFSGVTNYASGIQMVSNNEQSKLALLFEDFYSCIPFRNTLFGYEGTGFRSTEYFNLVSGTRFQIMPIGIESAYYLTPLFTPFFSCVSIALAYKMLMLMTSDRTVNGIQYALYFLIMFMTAVSPILYDMRILFQYFTQFFFFMWIFSWASRGVESLQR